MRCKGHSKMCKGLWCVQGPHLLPFCLYTLDNQYNLVQGPQLVALAHIRGPCTTSCGPCTYPSGPCTHLYLPDCWPLHMALAPLVVALAPGPCPEKMLLFSRLSGRFIWSPKGKNPKKFFSTIFRKNGLNCSKLKDIVHSDEFVQIRGKPQKWIKRKRRTLTRDAWSEENHRASNWKATHKT